MVERRAVVVRRRSARAILIDDDGYLVLIRRTRPGRAPYWTTAGGGVEDGDASIEAAMHRELAEELGAKAIGASQVFLDSWSREAGLYVQHFFVTRLASMDLSTGTGRSSLTRLGALRSGPVRPARGGAGAIDLQPAALKAFICMRALSRR